ncbi:MAG: hypothetical protein MUF23_17520 [Pirellula sp.]|nr:hypothetical protein [Pirellula sp.]
MFHEYELVIDKVDLIIGKYLDPDIGWQLSPIHFGAVSAFTVLDLNSTSTDANDCVMAAHP